MNVNLDVLELIFAQLDGTDLVASAQVSRAFLAGAIPSLYAAVEYTTRHAKRYQNEMSPFATLAAHDHLAVHVKRIAIYSAPLTQSAPNIVHPVFLDELTRALRTTTNLRSFICAVKILPPLIPHLVDKPRLRHLRIYAPIASRQMAVLQDRTGLRSLALDAPSWCVIDALPKWTPSMQKTLAHLTLFMSQDMDATVLNATLAHLPRLRGLHVIGCPRITHITVLKALSHTPDIRELSFTIFPSQDTTLPPLNFCIPPLTHLSIDIRASYPGLKSFIARIISRLSPRDALAICGGWIGEIKSSSERADPPPDGGGNAPGGPPPAAAGGGVNVWQHIQLHGPAPGHGHGHGHGNDDPPLLTPPVPHHGNAHPNPNPGAPPPIPALPTTVFGFAFPLGNPNGNNNNNNNNPPGGGPPNPLNPYIPDSNSPSLVSSLPSTLSTLHLPQISPAGLRDVVDRCQDIQLLGIVIGNAFASPASAKPSKMTGRSPGRSKRHAANSGVVRPEVSILAGVLSRARALRELIMDTSPTDIVGNGNGVSTVAGPGGSHGTSSGGYALLTPTAVRMLMRDSPLLRRIVAEGRVWESPTPTPPTPIPFPHRLDIELKLSKARYGPGANYNHAHGPPGFGSHGGGYGQMEAGNDHWFWLTDSASSGRVYSEF
ncbi:hypothetical protein EV363DRAFT_1451638 [Boletus edulis]|nr:hypothetical protein EV363DRAFT_1451638 [Boletus edulis]